MSRSVENVYLTDYLAGRLHVGAQIDVALVVSEPAAKMLGIVTDEPPVFRATITNIELLTETLKSTFSRIKIERELRLLHSEIYYRGCLLHAPQSHGVMVVGPDDELEFESVITYGCLKPYLMPAILYRMTIDAVKRFFQFGWLL